MAKDGDKKTFLIEPHSPYYLHPSEGPRVLITAEVFDGKNYKLWENAVRMALKAKNKLGFIDGTLERPEVREGDFTEYHAWDMVNSMVCSWLLNIIDRKLCPSVAYAETARAMWEDLQKRYGVASAPKIYQLKTSISECKQGGLEVVEFYSKLRGLWSELSNHVRIPHCSCKGCKCDISTKIVQMFEEEKSYQFLMGLNDDLYSHTRSQILALEPLPPLEKIFNIVSQEEQHKRLMIGRDEHTETAAAFATSHVKRIQASTEKGTCKHYGRLGHEEVNYFEIIGYPPGWGSRVKGRGRNRGFRGGRTSENRGRGGGRAAAYSAEHIVSGQQQEQEAVAAEQSNHAFSGFTNDQVQRLLSLIEPSKSACDKLTGTSHWIIDSGASRHMTGNMQLIKKQVSVRPILVIFAKFIDPNIQQQII